MAIVYDIIFFILALVYIPFLFLRGKWHSGFWMRLGKFSKEWLVAIQKNSGDYIWIHAVSVGEVMAILELVKRIKNEFKSCRIILSTVTTTGNELAKEKLGDDVDVIFAPLDFSFVVKKFVEIINPRIYIAAETELWPNLYNALDVANVPIVQVNGRISDKALNGYKRVKLLTKHALSCVRLFCVQSELDKDRIVSLGANEEDVYMVGNLKFDGLYFGDSDQVSQFGFNAERKLLVAGSTHPKEEEILIDTFKRLKKDFNELSLVIVPRHIERAEAIVEIVQARGLKPVLVSKMSENQMLSEEVLIVDKIGLLKNLFCLAEIVFVGKSFANGGGQNMIEPAGCGKPTFIGPRADNFKDVVNYLLSEKAIIQVQDEVELHEKMYEILSDEKKAKEMGLRAQNAVKKAQGATEVTFNYIKDILGKNCEN